MSCKTNFKLFAAIVLSILILEMHVSAEDLTMSAYNLNNLENVTLKQDSNDLGKISFSEIEAFQRNNKVMLLGEFDNYYDWQVLKITNKQRLANGLSPFSVCESLTEAAYERAYELTDYFSHTRPDGSGCSTVLDDYYVAWTSMGENIAAGYTNAELVVDGWMNSAGHRANILNEGYTHLGIGYCENNLSDYGTYWTQLFVDAECIPQITSLFSDIEYGAGYYQTGTSIDDMSLIIGATCDQHDECYIPVAVEMCDEFDINKTGVQELHIYYGDWYASVNIVMHPFKDVEHSWYTENVAQVYLNGYMTGYNETTFGTDKSILRSEFAVILYRMNGAPAVNYINKFPDVSEGDWYTNAVLWANSEGIISGYSHNGCFGPDDNITREQMAVMMHNYARSKGYDTSVKADFSKYEDAEDVSDFATEAMKWAVGNGIIKGKGSGEVLDPKGDATRAECATIIMRFVNKYEIK